MWVDIVYLFSAIVNSLLLSLFVSYFILPITLTSPGTPKNLSGVRLESFYARFQAIVNACCFFGERSYFVFIISVLVI